MTAWPGATVEVLSDLSTARSTAVTDVWLLADTSVPAGPGGPV